MSLCPRFFRALVAAALMLPATSLAQSVTANEKHFVIARIEQAPDIDGHVTDTEWAGATQVSDMHQVQPVEYDAPSERTEWFLFYNDKTLFVAARAYDSDPDAIVARTLRQGGSLNSDDSLRILVDAFNTKRSGYTFGLNPNGVRQEAIFTDGTQQSNDWDGIWRGAARRTDDGWSMEMAIPFNTLNFDPSNSIWGVNLWREIPRRNETIAWQSQNGRINPTVSGEMSGMKNISQGKGLDLTPSVSAAYLNDREIPRTDSELNPSLDINYKIGNAINALLTLNTDFAATEVDGRQLDLQRFSLFFPEKRSFFLTDFDIFQFGGVSSGGGDFSSRRVGTLSGTNGLAFFSRRIGLSSDNTPVDILVGTKLSGRLGEFDIGTLYIRQDSFEDISKKDLAVARIAKSVLGESTIGAIATYGDPQSNLDSSLVGLDFLYRNTSFAGDRTLESQWWVQKSNNEGLDGRDLAYNIGFSLPSREGFRAGAQYHVVEENFDPAMGFANRVGVRLTATEFAYNHVVANAQRLQEYATELRFSRWEYLDTGNIQSQRLELIPLRMRSVAGDIWRLSAKLNTEGLLPGEQPLENIGIFIPAGEYEFNRYGSFFRTAGYRKFSFNTWYEDGDFYNGRKQQINPGLSWRPNEHFGMRLNYDYNKYDFPGISTSTEQVTLETNVAFDARWSLTTLIQYDDISDDISINARLRFNVEAGRDIWLVLNHNRTKIPLEDRFRSTATLAVVKIRYTFRY